MNTVFKHLSFAPLNAAAMYDLAHSPHTGAVVLFSGEARNHVHDADLPVSHLFYEAFEEAAEASIAGILEAAIKKYALNAAFCIHRLGEVPLAESAVILVTAHARRKQAFDAAMYIMDRIKAETPIWKKETFSDGSSRWGVNAEALNKNKSIN